MKAKKIMAVLLAVSVIGSVAGCAKVKKITADDFIAACEKLGAEEKDYDDATAADESDFEDGIYTVLDSDQVAEFYSQTENSSAGMMGVSAPDFNSIIEADDIEQMVVLIRAEQNFDSISEADDLADLDVDAVVAIHVTLTGADMVEDIMDGLVENLDDIDIDVENLSSDEYYVGKNEGYLRCNISAEDLIAAYNDSDIAGYLEAMDAGVGDSLEGLTGNVSVATYINGENMVVLVGAAVNNTTVSLDDFCGYIGLQSPSKLDSNAEVAQSIMDYIDDTVGALIGAFASYAEY